MSRSRALNLMSSVGAASWVFEKKEKKYLWKIALPFLCISWLMNQSREGVLTRLRAWVRDPVKKVQVRFLRQKQWVVKTLVCCCFCCFNFFKPTCAAKIFCKKKRIKLSSPLTFKIGQQQLWFWTLLPPPLMVFFAKDCLLTLFKSRLALSRFPCCVLLAL